MKNGENKTRLIEAISEVLRSNFHKVLIELKCSVIYFSQEDITYCLKGTGMLIAAELSSNQEEADTKVILHCTILCKNLLIRKLYFAHLLATSTVLFCIKSFGFNSHIP